ncbi:MAG: tRNA (N(6)-L-threonylcarbamoyladenosine(37)-C(2))-methylthiotransferase MtaB [Alphaproteobacteria bacterium]|nr:tRNA (N(6)-L-threonylcarbamoyladenosine(37)-C(2))-methylthiotransferase MtaB [Alphaproteobacteria bacterium]
MKQPPREPKVVTFGCRLNNAESEAMQAYADAAGLDDTIIVNTCAVTAEAERQAGQAIRKLKRENPEAKIIVTGCSAQISAEKYRSMPEVSGVIQNDAKLKAETFAALTPGGKRLGTVSRILSPQENAMQRAFVQVQNGCDHKCTFCVIPYGRGASRSVSFETVAAQAQAYVDAGYNEVVLTGVDIASYGRDLPGEPTLGYMVKHVLRKVPGLRRLRLSSLDPAAIDEDLWEALAEEPRLMPHIHLSLQAGDNLVLKRMKRRHLREDVLRLVDRARKYRPEIVFGADIITGFPTESEEMFVNTVDLVNQCGLTWLHVFPYSARKGTPAAKMPQVHGAQRKERAERLRVLGDELAGRYYRSLIGTGTEVLVEKNGVGCTPQFAKLKLLGAPRVGAIVNVKCVHFEKDSVIAEVMETA